jgi:hypothetical protein
MQRGWGGKEPTKAATPSSDALVSVLASRGSAGVLCDEGSRYWVLEERGAGAGPKGIRTNIIAAGAIRTPTNVAVLKGEEALQKLNSLVSLGRIGEPEDIADVVAFLYSG